MKTPFALAMILISCADKSFPTEELTLDNCETNVDGDVPDFYSKYFQCVDISMDGDNVKINSDGLPPHKTYYYSNGHPNYVDWDDRGGEYRANPNVIEEQNLSISFPQNPSPKGLTIDDGMVDGDVNSSEDEYGMGTQGIAIDGVSIFNSLAAPGDVIEDEVTSFDLYNAHPEMQGNYHYHTDTVGPLEVLEFLGLSSDPTPGSNQVEFYGIMCDGTFVLGCSELDASEVDTSEFDSQNGHVHNIDDGEHTIEDRYHVHMCTADFTNHKFTPEIQYYSECSN